MNPLFTIWTQPKKTVQYMLDHKSVSYGLVLIILAAISSGMLAFSDTGVLGNFSLPGILTISIVTILLISIPAWFINAGLYTWIGKLLGGTGNIRNMCLAVAAGATPGILMLPIGIIALLIYGQSLFVEPPGMFAITNMSLGFYIFYNIIMVAVAIFGTVILSKGIGLVHNFSAWRGFGTIMIVVGIILAILAVIGVGLVIFIIFLGSLA